MLLKNVIAAFLGRSATIVLQLICTPLYIHFLQLEGFGLVGFFNSLLALSAILDCGLTSCLQKQLPEFLAQKQLARMCNCARTAEILYWTQSLILALILYLLAPFFAKFWFSSHHLTQEQLVQTLIWMGLSISFQWPFFIYMSGLMSLQKHTKANMWLIVFAILRSAGALIVLSHLSSTTEAFFLWQMVCSLLQTLFFYLLFWKSMPKEKARFSLVELKSMRSFALGVSGIAITGLILTHIDKVILSKTLTLDTFGMYCLCTSCANGLYCLIIPLFSAFFPKFSEIKTVPSELCRVFHLGSKWMSALLMAPALLLTLFPYEIIMLWTQDSSLARQAGCLIPYLATAVMLHGLIYIPYALQLAHGWTSLTFWQNFLGVFFLVPLTYILSINMGARGAVFAPLMINICYFTIGIAIFYKQMIPTEKIKWYRDDIMKPFLIVFIVLLSAKLCIPLKNFSMLSQFVILATLGLSSMALAWFVVFNPRAFRINKVSR